MRVAQRLFLAVIPAVVGVLVVAALSYWGRFAYVVPEWVLVVAVVAAAGSLVVAWINTRYIATRIDRLAARVGESTRAGPRTTRTVAQAVTDVVAPRQHGGEAPDELDAIEQTMKRLSSEVSVAAAERQAQLDALDATRKEYATLLSDASNVVAHALDDVRLPIHILLDNHFGELNENQEEMLGAARNATEKLTSEIDTLRDIADFDRGAMVLRNDVVRIQDVLGSLTPSLLAEGKVHGVEVRVDVAPGIPAIRGDRRRIQESVSAVLLEILGRSPEGSAISIEAEFDAQAVRIMVNHGADPPKSTVHALPRRLLSASHATLTEAAGRTLIAFAR